MWFSFCGSVIFTQILKKISTKVNSKQCQTWTITFPLKFYLIQQTPLKMMKEDIQFILKALFVLKISKFLS